MLFAAVRVQSDATRLNIQPSQEVNSMTSFPNHLLLPVDLCTYEASIAYQMAKW